MYHCAEGVARVRTGHCLGQETTQAPPFRCLLSMTLEGDHMIWAGTRNDIEKMASYVDEQRRNEGIEDNQWALEALHHDLFNSYILDTYRRILAHEQGQP